MKNKIIVWMIGLLILTSLAWAASIEDVNSVYPDLIGGDAKLGSDETDILVKHVREKPLALLKNEDEIQIKSFESWMNELRKKPPRSKKIDSCVTKESLSRAECADLLVGKYMDKFKLTDAERALINQLPPDEKSYLFSSLGRSRGKVAMVVYWMIRHPQFSYILFHENFHTYTTEKVNLLKQIELTEENLADATANRKVELQNKLNIQKQQALFVILWTKYVGREKDVLFSKYGQVNLYESLSEFFARFWSYLLIKDLEEFDRDRDKIQIEKYISAVAIAECFGLEQSLDGIYGKGVFETVLNVINADPMMKPLYDSKKSEITADAGSCPPSEPEPMIYTGDAHLCKYNLKENGRNIEVQNCEFGQVFELITSSQDGYDSVYVARGSGVMDIGYLDMGEFVITDIFGEDEETYNGEADATFDPDKYGWVTIPAVGGVLVEDVTIYMPDPDKPLEFIKSTEFNPVDLEGAEKVVEEVPFEIEEIPLEIEEIPIDELYEVEVVEPKEIGVVCSAVYDENGLLQVEAGPGADVDEAIDNYNLVGDNLEEYENEIDGLVGEILQGNDVAGNRQKIWNLVFGGLLTDEELFLMSLDRVEGKFIELNNNLDDLNEDLSNLNNLLVGGDGSNPSSNRCVCEKGAWATYMCNELEAEQPPEQESYTENGVEVLFRKKAGHYIHGEWHGVETLSDSAEMDSDLLEDHGPFISCRKDIEIDGTSPCYENTCDNWCKFNEPTSEALLYGAINKFCKEKAEKICGSEPIHIVNALNPYYFPQYGISSGFYAEGYCENIDIT